MESLSLEISLLQQQILFTQEKWLLPTVQGITASPKKQRTCGIPALQSLLMSFL